jgi:uncharacterized protein (DUF488 family)
VISLMSQLKDITALTLGHSTRTLDEFIGLLEKHEVSVVVDVRTVPRSRYNPQFNKETLPNALRVKGVKYIHMPELGGLRRAQADSVNLAWENKSFRGYADYMQTKEFAENLLKLVAFIRENCVVVMCAEAVPWRCHRILISDALVARNIKVIHILSETGETNHELTPFAHVEGTKITYPLFVKEKPQRTLSDFGTQK